VKAFNIGKPGKSADQNDEEADWVQLKYTVLIANSYNDNEYKEMNRPERAEVSISA